MEISRRFMASAAAVIASLALGAQPAFAAAPGNDTIEGATTVTLGISDVVNTTEATTDAVDAQANDVCGAPATDASVWYSRSVAVDTGVIVDVSASDFSTGVLVVVGSPGALETVACGPAFSAVAGTTYRILAFDDQGDGGGTLNISFRAAPPPPTVDFTVAPRNTVDSTTGVATLHGTYTCIDAVDVDVAGEVAQSVERVATIRDLFFVSDIQTCDGTPHPWSAQVAPETGKFAGGKAQVITFWFACGQLDCTNGTIQQTVQFTGGRT
jgi:hypothetical protein